MWTHNLNPVIFSLGPLAIRWYSLVYVVGFLLAYWLLLRAVKDGSIKGLDEKGVDQFMTWFIILVIACSRLVYAIFYNPAYYLDAPWKILFLWEGGLSFHGGLIGGVLAGILFSRKRKVKFYALADLIVVPTALMLVFGRLANFINGELPGIITDPSRVPWCVVFPAYGPECRHPTQLYEAAKNLLVFAALLPLAYVKSLSAQLKQGTLFWLFVLLYGFGRFLTDIWREADTTDFLVGATGLLTGQWLSLVMVVVAVVFLIRIYARK